jgi:flagellar motility protein MotE (MotC chaperone)
MKHVKLFENFVLESKLEDEARAILQDLLDEYDPFELQGMTPEEAEDTVDSYGHKGSKAKKIASILQNLASDSTTA